MTKSAIPWKADRCDHGIIRFHEIRQEIYRCQTARQLIEISDFENFGIGLYLDNSPQCSLLDSHIYHQAFVHTAILLLDLRKKPFHVGVLGGGDFGVAQELCRYHPAMVGDIKIIDWDLEFVEIAKKYLEPIHNHAWKDPRVRLETKTPDAFEFLRHAQETFHCIFSDLTDMDLSEKLLPQFGSHVKRCLEPKGVLVIQAGAFPGTPSELSSLCSGLEKFEPHFQNFWIYKIFVPFFGYEQAFIIATNDIFFNPLSMHEDDIDRKVERYLNTNLSAYNGKVHHAMFAIPPYLTAKIGAVLGKKFRQA